MQKVTKMPIGLGMNHLEQEIAACHIWNRHVEAGAQPDEWISLSESSLPPYLFSRNPETGLSLENQGFLEIDTEGQQFRLTPKAIALLEKFVAEQ